MEEHVKDNYYFTRSVNVIPVIDLYLNTSDIKITYIYSKIQSIFDKYLSNLSEASVQENKYYLDNQKNISRVNGYSACIPIENLTIKCEKSKQSKEMVSIIIQSIRKYTPTISLRGRRFSRRR